MLDKVLSAKIREYAPTNQVEQENVLQELMQHYVLAGLSRDELAVSGNAEALQV